MNTWNGFLNKRQGLLYIITQTEMALRNNKVLTKSWDISFNFFNILFEQNELEFCVLSNA